MKKALTAKDYESLADLRHHVRRFLHFSELAVCEVGLEPRRHQLMLALKGLPRGTRPRIGELAERLQIRQHRAVELVDRLATGGYRKRQKAENNRREVLLTLTPQGGKSAASTIAAPPSRTAQRGSRMVRGSPASHAFDREHEWAGHRPA
jgi:DNA-binding MarR family transcriptional regulator